MSEHLNYLMQHPHNRSSETIQLLMQLTAGLKCFQQLKADTGSDEMHQACCRVMKLERFPPSTEIVTVGAEGLTFHIMLKGTATVLVPAKEAVQANSGEVEGYRTVMKAVSTIVEGSAFGELALLSGKPRAATVRAETEVITAVLTKEHFDVFLADQVRRALEEVLSFLQSIPVFSLYTRDSLYKLSYYAKSLPLFRHQELFTEQNSADALFLVKNGEFELRKTVVVGSTSVLKPRQAESRLVKSISASKSVIKRKTIVLCTKSTSEIIGLQELTNKSKTYKCTCVCVSGTAEVLKISREDFMLRVSHNDTWNSLVERSSDEAERLQQRMKASIRVESSKDSLNIVSSPVYTTRANRHAWSPLNWKSTNYPSIARLKRTELPPSSNRLPAVCLHPFSKPKERAASLFKRTPKTSTPKKLGPPANFYRGMLERLKRKYTCVAGRESPN